MPAPARPVVLVAQQAATAGDDLDRDAGLRGAAADRAVLLLSVVFGAGLLVLAVVVLSGRRRRGPSRDRTG